jgi:nicotinamide riboside transporter PnuC
MIRLLIIALIVICVVILQIVLSRTKSKIPGLVLPALCFLFSLIVPLNMIVANSAALLFWLIVNIPTIILLLVYFVCRQQYKKKNQIEKMKIQDLE